MCLCHSTLRVQPQTSLHRWRWPDSVGQPKPLRFIEFQLLPKCQRGVRRTRCDYYNMSIKSPRRALPRPTGVPATLSLQPPEATAVNPQLSFLEDGGHVYWFLYLQVCDGCLRWGLTTAPTEPKPRWPRRGRPGTRCQAGQRRHLFLVRC